MRSIILFAVSAVLFASDHGKATLIIKNHTHAKLKLTETLVFPNGFKQPPYSSFINPLNSAIYYEEFTIGSKMKMELAYFDLKNPSHIISLPICSTTLVGGSNVTFQVYGGKNGIICNKK